MNYRSGIFSIGHSTLSYDRFLQLCREHELTAIADVRSAPYSRRSPHFNRDIISDELRADKIAYVFLGDALGGRPKDRRFLRDGVADYEKMAAASEFTKGLDRVVEGATRYRVALMCSEHDPLDCHRCLLVGRALRERSIMVSHILSSGETRVQEQIEAELLTLSGQNENQTDIFASPDERMAAAYRSRVKKVAYSVSIVRRSNGIAAE